MMGKQKEFNFTRDERQDFVGDKCSHRLIDEWSINAAINYDKRPPVCTFEAKWVIAGDPYCLTHARVVALELAETDGIAVKLKKGATK